MDIIHSKDNPLIKQIRKLKERKHRTAEGKFLIEGIKFIEEAVRAGSEISFIFISEDYSEKWRESQVSNKVPTGTKIYFLTEQLLRQLSSTETPQGAIAVVNTLEKSMGTDNGFFVLVDKIQDPGNLGTIIRTAHAGGAHGVICTRGTVDIYNEKTLRSTMGSIFHIPVVMDNELDKVLELKNRGFKVIVSSLDTDKDFFQADLTGNIIICIGNEGNGISEEILNLGDICIKIPMPGGAESLNAAVAGSIMIYETVRQRIKKSCAF